MSLALASSPTSIGASSIDPSPIASLDCLIVQSILDLHMSAPATGANGSVVTTLVGNALKDLRVYLDAKNNGLFDEFVGHDAHEKALGGVRDIIQAITMNDGFARAVALKIAPALKTFAANARSYPLAHSVASWRFLLGEISTSLQLYIDGDDDAGDHAFKLIANNIESLWD